jgi:NTE family protein
MPNDAVMAQPAASQTAGEDARKILVLQGGGALGSYQAGVFEALAEYGMQPEYVAGVSIGAINASLIAGNPPERRTERLRAFWDKVTSPTADIPALPLPGWQNAEQRLGAAGAFLFGQPGFFRPRPVSDWLTLDPPVSFYDTSDLRSTLEELVDFDRINAGETRLAVGAVHVETGNMIYFDSKEMRLTPSHILASGALPPGFESVEIGGEAFWDGGLVSNTPLQYVLMERPRRHSLVFQVDLFPSRGKRPRNLDEVAEREKDIRYSSRTRAGTNEAGEIQNMCRQVRLFLDRLPKELQDDPVARRLHDFACGALIDVVHLIYRPAEPQGAHKDVQFDRGTMLRRWAEGRRDAEITLREAPWRTPAPDDVGFRTFDAFRP